MVRGFLMLVLTTSVSAYPGGQQLADATTTAATGIMKGTATDAVTHKAIGAVVVTIVRGGSPSFSQTATAGQDGTFEFDGLSAGTYSLCAQAPAAGYLNPCDFASLPQTVTLAAGQISSGNLLKMVAGSILHVRIQDPQQLAIASASQKSATTQLPDIQAGVWAPGFPGSSFHPARLTGTDSSGLDYEVTVPLNIPLAFHLSSRHLKLVDAGGAALASNAIQQRFQHNSGDANPKAFTFAITAVIP